MRTIPSPVKPNAEPSSPLDGVDGHREKAREHGNPIKISPASRSLPRLR